MCKPVKRPKVLRAITGDVCKRVQFHLESTTVTLLYEKSYKGTVEFGIKAQQLQPKTCLLDTGAALDQVSSTFLKMERLTNIKIPQPPGLHTATQEPISL